MKKTLLCALLCLMGCFFLSACVKPPIPPPKNIMQPTQALFDGLDLLEPQAIPMHENLLGQESYYIVVDDGLGMKGFISTHCQSYRAAITAVSGVSMSSESTCVRASELVRENSAEYSSTKKFFEEAVNENFFQSKSNDAASVIQEMTEVYRDHPDSVMILISDLMIPTEDDCLAAAKALQEDVIAPEHATMGIIGIMGDFRGAIENLPVSPTTGYRRKISDYMVKEKDVGGNFKHPLYVLFFGNDQAVLNAMEKALSSLKKSSMLNQEEEIKALYLAEYDITRRDKDDVKTTFNLGYPDYNDVNYPIQFLIRGINDASGEPQYEPSVTISETHQQMLNDLRIAKLYASERGNAEKNVKIRCEVPFTLTDSSINGACITDSNDLVIRAKDFNLEPEDYAIKTEVRVLDYSEQQNGKAQASWVTADPALISCDSAVIGADCKRVDIVLTVDTTLLGKDEPLLCEVFVRIAATPKWEAIQALYDTSWIEAWTLNIKEFDYESITLGQTESSARFTSATTARTPFLNNLIFYGVVEEQMQQVDIGIREKTEACMQTTMFGIVVRDVPIRYDDSYSWDYTENFGGWAFSEEQAEIIRAAID
ncbi:MAG: hypothetical protein C0413_02450 [Clostridiales bacterium]|nr:hypothetical protein [Clostridiales bacterium]